MDNYGISKNPWHWGVTAVVLVCLAGVAIWLYRREPIYRVHLFKKYQRGFERGFALIAVIAYLVFEFTYEVMSTSWTSPPPVPLYAWAIQFTWLPAFVFLRHASRFEICTKICAGGVGAFCILILPWPGTIVCGGSLALLYATDYVVVRPRLRRKTVIAVRIVSAAIFIIFIIAFTLLLLLAAVIAVF